MCELCYHFMSDWQLIQEGVAFGLLLSVMVGPIVITLIQSCMQGGKVAGFEVSAGIWLSDIIILTIAYLGLVSLTEKIGGYSIESWLQYLGGAVFLAVGFVIMIRKYRDMRSEPIHHKWTDHGKFFVKGFLVNTVNPFTFVFWIGVTGSRIIARGLDDRQAWIYLFSILFMIVLTDSIKVLLSDYIRDRINFKALVIVQRIAGGILAAVGLYLLIFYKHI